MISSNSDLYRLIRAELERRQAVNLTNLSDTDLQKLEKDTREAVDAEMNSYLSNKESR